MKKTILLAKFLTACTVLSAAAVLVCYEKITSYASGKAGERRQRNRAGHGKT